MTEQNYKDEAGKIREDLEINAHQYCCGGDFCDDLKSQQENRDYAIKAITEALQRQYAKGWNDAVEEARKVADKIEKGYRGGNYSLGIAEQIGRLRK